MTTHDENGHTPLCYIAQSKFEELDLRFTQRIDEAEKRICQTFKDMDRRLDQRFALTQLAIEKSEHAMNARLEHMNQFRTQILDERTTFATKRESVLVNFVISLVLVAVGLFFAHLLAK
jgi:predicted PurR-regulated permease PerM